MIMFPIPELTQGSDQSAIVKISDIIDPGFILVHPQSREYVMRVSGDPHTDDLDLAEGRARGRFFQLLGVLRAFKHGRGELKSEVTRSVARDEHGGQILRVGTARAYAMFPGELEAFAARASARINSDPGFGEALWLFGQPNRSAATYYSIYELAVRKLGGRDGIRKNLGVSSNRQDEFTKSANHLRPADGGRHALGNPGLASMDLKGLSEFTTQLMRAWINAS